MNLLEVKEKNISIDVVQKENIPKVKKIGSAHMIMSQIPTLIGAQQLATAYKVIIPAGAVGKLMELNNGLLSTVMVNGRKISAHAGLQSLSKIASPMAIFSVVSMITGQYFMAEINKSLKSLMNGITDIQRQITIKEESIVFSASIFLHEIINDWPLIISSDEYKTAIISNMITVINDLTASCYYFQKMLLIQMEKFEKDILKNKISEYDLKQQIYENENFLKKAFELRSSFKSILLFLTTTITKENYATIIEILNKDAAYIFVETVKKIDKQVDSIVSLFKESPSLKMQEQAKDMSSPILELRKIANDSYNNKNIKNISETIFEIASIDEKGKEFFLIDGELCIEAV